MGISKLRFTKQDGSFDDIDLSGIIGTPVKIGSNYINIGTFLMCWGEYPRPSTGRNCGC
jgi:hypothetical protein